eukprot:m.203474 g.203474  ORF g.203474 m.203474 type:complete len:166 (-) comp21977_c15_seq1:438-935(-)
MSGREEEFGYDPPPEYSWVSVHPGVIIRLPAEVELLTPDRRQQVAEECAKRSALLKRIFVLGADAQLEEKLEVAEESVRVWVRDLLLQQQEQEQHRRQQQLQQLQQLQQQQQLLLKQQQQQPQPPQPQQLQPPQPSQQPQPPQPPQPPPQPPQPQPNQCLLPRHQ